MNKIKILHVINTLCVGGIEQTVVNICNNLDKNKYEVTLWVLTETHQELLSRLNNDVNVLIFPLNKHRRVAIDIAYLFLSFGKLRRKLLELAPDIIHTHMYQYNVFPFFVVMIASHLKFQHFHTIHTSGLHYIGKTILHCVKLYVEKMCYRFFSTHLICVSKEVKRSVIKCWSNSCGEFRVIENGIDMKQFDRNLFSQKTDDIFIVSYVARLVKGKNHFTLLQAINLLKKKYVNICLWLIGDGDLRDELREYVIANKIEDSVRFWGNVENVPSVLAQSVIAAFPSEYEGFSVAMIEMMSMGLPVVCSDIQCFKDLLGDDGALYFPVHDAEKLAKQIEKLYLDKNLLEQYVMMSINLSSEYSMENMVMKYEKCYNDIIQR